MKEYTALHLFAGIGGAALGFQGARTEYKGMVGTWHRPLTTLELAVLQSLKPFMPDGRPLQLAGNSDARWRERIGNMVPKNTAKAIAEEILLSFLASEIKDDWQLNSAGIWVVPCKNPVNQAQLN